MSSLKKPIKDLNRKDLMELAKPLGVKGRPYPMRKTEIIENDKGEKTQVNRLGMLERNDKPLVVFSERDYADILGMAMRDMPTPSMLPMFFDAIVKRHPENNRRIQFYKGAAGAGKTYMSEMIGRMRSEEGAIKIDCANLNMAELLYETVLDFNSDRSFYNELDKRLANGTLNPVSVKTLKGALGEAWTEENGKAAIDWGKVGQNLRDPSQKDKKAEDRDFLPSEEAVAIAVKALHEVSELEGLGAMGGNTLGMITQEGPLIKAFKEGREIILDEFNRCKKGTTGALHGVLQFVINDIDECPVHNSLKEKGNDASSGFKFRREDMKAGFFVTLTGNTETDGTDVEELPQSLSSRIIPKHVPLATEEDWQHRICQIMTGLPVSTIYYSSQKQWDANPEAFRQKLVEWRQLREEREVPDIQLRLLRNWEGLVEASEKLARFYYGWSQIVDPDSATHRASSLTQLLDEIDDIYSAEVSIDFRKILAHVAEAMEDRPTVLSAEESEGYDLNVDLSQMPVLSEEIFDRADLAMDFGTRLSDVLVQHINETTRERGKVALYNQLIRHAADCGVVPPQLHEGKASASRTIAECLNDNPYESKAPDIQAELVRDMLCDYLRLSHKDISAKNDDIMPVGVIRRALDEIEQPAVDEVAEVTLQPEALIFNDDPDHLHVKPFVKVANVDMTPDASAPHVRKAVPATDTLASQSEILSSLAAPALRHHNLRAMWNKALSKSGMVADGADVGKDESLAMAQNDADSGFSVTTIMVRSDEAAAAKAVPLHLVWNQAQDSLLVVGEGRAAPDLKKAFNHSRVFYVNRLEEGADKQVSSALSSVLGKEGRKLEPLMKNAFLMRNMLSSSEDESSAGLDSLLVRNDVKCYLPHYLVKPAAPKMS